MNQFKGKKVLIFGLGLNQGGVGSSKFFAKQGAIVRITDLKATRILKPSLDQLKQFKNIEYSLGQHKYADVTWADLIIKNPAVKPGNLYIEYAKKKNKPVKMDMDIFLEYVKPFQLIGITGTKGKSTTASLIYEILRSAQDEVNVIFAGNIGKSVLDTIPHVKKETLVILEISSFQLESFEAHKVSPKYAVITNIYQDHLNYYKNMDEYIYAKKIIGKDQTKDDFLFIRKGDPVADKPRFLKAFKGKIIRFSKEDLPKNFKSYLLGEHNRQNLAAAYALVKAFGLDAKVILAKLSQFKGIPFRMELIKVWYGVKIINDTTATGPDAGAQAIKTFPGCILIAGGMNKGLDYTKYATIVAKNVKKVFFLEGDATNTILSSLRPRAKRGGSNLEIHGPYNNLEKLLTDIKEGTGPGDTILFSPAATSFNLFQNEFDRGTKFNQAVQKVFG